MFDPSEILLELPVFQYGAKTLDNTTQDFTISDSLLEPVTPILFGPYWPRVELFPGKASSPLAPRQQIEGSIRVPARSFLVGFSAASPQAAGFQFQIFDVGRNDYAFTPKWQNNLCVMDDTDTDRAMPYLLIRPYPIVDAGAGWGKLQIRIVNAAAANNDCQLALHFAIPGGRTQAKSPVRSTAQ